VDSIILSTRIGVRYSKGVLKEHLTTINGKSSNFSIDDFLVVAQKNLIDQKSAKYIIDTIAAKLSTYKMRAKDTGISESEATKIGTEIHTQLVRLGFV
jgi:hypothetical protein